MDGTSKRESRASIASVFATGAGPPARVQRPTTHGPSVGDGPGSPLHADDDDLSTVSTAESAFSLPDVEVRVSGYLNLIGESAAAADRLDASVGAVIALRKALDAASAVPPNVSRRLTVLTSSLYRSSSEACLAVTELSKLVVRFTRGLVVSEELGRLQAEIDRRGAERDAARLRALEAERKHRVAAAALQRWRGDIATYRWQRVITKALSRHTLRVVHHRLSALRARINRQARLLQTTRNRLATAKRVLSIAADHDTTGAVAAAAAAVSAAAGHAANDEELEEIARRSTAAAITASRTPAAAAAAAAMGAARGGSTAQLARTASKPPRDGGGDGDGGQDRSRSAASLPAVQSGLALPKQSSTVGNAPAPEATGGGDAPARQGVASANEAEGVGLERRASKPVGDTPGAVAGQAEAKPWPEATTEQGTDVAKDGKSHDDAANTVGAVSSEPGDRDVPSMTSIPTLGRDGQDTRAASEQPSRSGESQGSAQSQKVTASEGSTAPEAERPGNSLEGSSSNAQTPPSAHEAVSTPAAPGTAASAPSLPSAGISQEQAAAHVHEARQWAEREVGRVRREAQVIVNELQQRAQDEARKLDDMRRATAMDAERRVMEAEGRAALAERELAEALQELQTLHLMRQATEAERRRAAAAQDSDCAAPAPHAVGEPDESPPESPVGGGARAARSRFPSESAQSDAHGDTREPSRGFAHGGASRVGGVERTSDGMRSRGGSVATRAASTHPGQAIASQPRANEQQFVDKARESSGTGATAAGESLPSSGTHGSPLNVRKEAQQQQLRVEAAVSGLLRGAVPASRMVATRGQGYRRDEGSLDEDDNGSSAASIGKAAHQGVQQQPNERGAQEQRWHQEAEEEPQSRYGQPAAAKGTDQGEGGGRGEGGGGGGGGLGSMRDMGGRGEGGGGGSMRDMGGRGEGGGVGSMRDMRGRGEGGGGVGSMRDMRGRGEGGGVGSMRDMRGRGEGRSLASLQRDPGAAIAPSNPPTGSVIAIGGSLPAQTTRRSRWQSSSAAPLSRSSTPPGHEKRSPRSSSPVATGVTRQARALRRASARNCDLSRSRSRSRSPASRRHAMDEPAPKQGHPRLAVRGASFSGPFGYRASGGMGEDGSWEEEGDKADSDAPVPIGGALLRLSNTSGESSHADTGPADVPVFRGEAVGRDKVAGDSSRHAAAWSSSHVSRYLQEPPQTKIDSLEASRARMGGIDPFALEEWEAMTVAAEGTGVTVPLQQSPWGEEAPPGVVLSQSLVTADPADAAPSSNQGLAPSPIKRRPARLSPAGDHRRRGLADRSRSSGQVSESGLRSAVGMASVGTSPGSVVWPSRPPSVRAQERERGEASEEHWDPHSSFGEGGGGTMGIDSSRASPSALRGSRRVVALGEDLPPRAPSDTGARASQQPPSGSRAALLYARGQGSVGRRSPRSRGVASAGRAAGTRERVEHGPSSRHEAVARVPQPRVEASGLVRGRAPLNAVIAAEPGGSSSPITVPAGGSSEGEESEGARPGQAGVSLLHSIDMLSAGPSLAEDALPAAVEASMMTGFDDVFDEHNDGAWLEDEAAAQDSSNE